MSNEATRDYPIHEVISKRWSPCVFSSQAVPADILRSLFEAARWAPSSYNEQPWSYLVATQENPEEFQKLLSCLVEGNQAWAKHAPVLVITCTSEKFARNDKPNKACEHDIGLASATLTFEATARGLYVHQMIGIEPEKIRAQYEIPEGVKPMTAIAIGYLGDPETGAPEHRERDEATPERKPISEFVFTGKWGTISPLVDVQSPD